MRQAVIVALAALFLVTGAVEFGFSGTEKEAAGPEKMVCTYAQMANDFFLTFDKGAKEAVEALGNTYVAATDERRPEKFLSQMQSF
jgi:ABC-type sugar transport system substrate-binding protein